MTGTQYYFRKFRLDPAARELWQDDRQVVLPASALDGLIYLIEHRARAVGRDELIAAIWGRADVADTLLAQTVLRIRRELGDTGTEQSAIRTVPRFGYRWVAETKGEEGAPAPALTSMGATAQATASPDPVLAAADAVPPAPVPIAPEVSIRRPWVALGIAVLVLLAIAAAFQLRQPQRAAVAPESAPAAFAAFVLPATVPDLTEWSWLRLGLMDLVASRLRSGGLATVPSESVLALLRQAADAKPALPDALAVQPAAAFRDGQWTVTLSATKAGETVSAQASAGDVLAAARAAVDELLIRLGRAPPAGDATSGLALQELLQRTRAAILADQFDLARSLIAHAPIELQRDPEVALRAAQIDIGQGDYAPAQRALTLLLDEAGRHLAPALHGRILNTLGGVQVRRDDLAGADASYAEAIGELQNANDAIGLGQAYTGRAAIAARHGDTAAAMAELGRARVSFEAGGDPFGVAQVDMNLGVLAALRYRPADALPVLQDAAARFARIGAREELGYARYALIGVQLQLLDVAGARATSDAAWPLDRHTGNPRLRWQLTLARSGVLLNQGRLDEADALLAQIDREAAVDLDASVRASARALAAAVAAARGSDAQALTLAEAAMTPDLERDDADAYLDTWMVRLRALRGSGRIAEAAAATTALRAWVDRHANDWRQLAAALAAAEQAWSEGRRDAALTAFADAAARADRLGLPEGRVEAGVGYLRALLALGQHDRASAVAGALAPWAQTDVRAAAAAAELFRALDRSEAWRRAAERANQLAGERVLPAPVVATATGAPRP